MRDIDVQADFVSVCLLPAYVADQVTIDHVIVTDRNPSGNFSQLDLRGHGYLQGLLLEDVGPDTSIGVLTGMDHASLIMPLEIHCDPSSVSQLYATGSCFGWSLNGPLENAHSGEYVVNFCVFGSEGGKPVVTLESENDEAFGHSINDGKVLSLWQNELRREGDHKVCPYHGGMISQTSSTIYLWLNTGWRA